MSNQIENYVFDATQHDMETRELIPAGTYDVVISNTDVKDLKDNKGWCLMVTFSVTGGEYAGRTVSTNYNLGHNSNPETVRIAHKQLSSLCHAIGRYQVTTAAKGAELRGGALRVLVANDGTYNNVKNVYDAAGNVPTRAGSGAPAATTATSWAQPTPAPVAVVAPAPAPVAPPVSPEAVVAPAFPPAGWTAHPSAPGYFYQGSEVLSEEQLRAKFAAPVAPPAPPAAPALAAPVVQAQPSSWAQATETTVAAPWGTV